MSFCAKRWYTSTVEVSVFVLFLCWFQSKLNLLQVSCGLFHVTLAASLKRLDELSSAVFYDHDVLFSDGIVLPLNVILWKLIIVFLICFLIPKVMTGVFPQSVTLFLILLDDKAKVFDLALDGKLLRLVLRRGLSRSILGLSLELAVRWLEFASSGFLLIWWFILIVLFVIIIIYFYNMIDILNDWIWLTVDRNSLFGPSLVLHIYLVFRESRAEDLGLRNSSRSGWVIVLLFVSNAMDIVRRLWNIGWVIHGFVGFSAL